MVGTAGPCRHSAFGPITRRTKAPCSTPPRYGSLCGPAEIPLCARASAQALDDRVCRGRARDCAQGRRNGRHQACTRDLRQSVRIGALRQGSGRGYSTAPANSFTTSASSNYFLYGDEAGEAMFETPTAFTDEALATIRAIDSVEALYAFARRNRSAFRELRNAGPKCTALAVTIIAALTARAEVLKKSAPPPQPTISVRRRWMRSNGERLPLQRKDGSETSSTCSSWHANLVSSAGGSPATPTTCALRSPKLWA